MAMMTMAMMMMMIVMLVVAGKPGGVVETVEAGGVRSLPGVSGLQHRAGGGHHQY